MDSNFMVSRYKILGELGRGGMGVVYKAHDTRLDRMVALKILEKCKSGKDIKRFIHEVRALSQLHHPNIIRIYEYGETPTPFFTMEIVQGENLSDFFKTNPGLSPKEIAEIVEKVTEAICEVHKRKIIHRDIKPSNIMLTANKQPKLMDFGLAKSDLHNDQLSVTGEILGSVSYMSPEQARGKAELRSDIYSLGATLYQGLTGQKVFSSESTYEAIYNIFNEAPKRPREINPQIPMELENICIKCLEKKLENRYQTAFELLRDLRNFRNDRRVKAKRSESASLKTLFSYTQKIVLLLAISLCVVLWFQNRSQQREMENHKKLSKTTINDLEDKFKNLNKLKVDELQKKLQNVGQKQIQKLKEEISVKDRQLIKLQEQIMNFKLSRNKLINDLHQLARSRRKEEKKYDDAIKIYNIAENYSNDPNIPFGRGVTYLVKAINDDKNINFLNKAVENFKIAVEKAKHKSIDEAKRKQTLADVYSNLGVCYSLMGDERRCLEAFEFCFQYGEPKQSHYCNRAIAYHFWLRQDKKTAIEDLEKANRLPKTKKDPHNKFLINTLIKKFKDKEPVTKQYIFNYYPVIFN
ncbi:serine/threonine-protein kinase [Candidatus Uabimicrobium amorphum]|uniref:Protein kinase n=1 Tax=Uabimicrobium amorphum TaxID=2596890 RepID=A0A5S9IL39_UABAM|nr:serine/threonine-protein kinase [Candidatus Uabimicrobium amorphum]BBM83507.1 protein kinase [Candidatus Uabimicrobium amorphum]